MWYVAGPMSGIEGYNYPAFEQAVGMLRGRGFSVASPHELDEPGHVPGDWSWGEYLRRDLKMLLDCDGVVTLHGWEQSRGASLEVDVARRLGMPVVGLCDLVPPLVGLCGFAGAGKDVVAGLLGEMFGFCRVAFADPIREIASRVGWDGVKDDGGRRLLQGLGVGVREVVGEDVWLDVARDSICELSSPVVVSDCRFPNEIGMVRELGGVVVRVDRPGVGPVNGHVSETAWNGVVPDFVVVNAGTVDGLRPDVSRVRDLAVNEVRYL